jgi:hypothetical protein
LYWYDAEGKRYLTPEELVKQEAQRAQQEAQRAQRLVQRTQQLEQRLRELGVDPDNLD